METIAAIATAQSPSAIGIVRLSGDETRRVLAALFTPASGMAVEALPYRRMTYGDIRSADGTLLDRGMAVCFSAAHSYTGEESAELHCHGSPVVLSEVLQAAFAAGARQARPGEFTQRAFLNGKLDLTEAEAVIDLIDAETADAAANAAGQVAGVLRAKLDPIYDQLMDICSHFHAVLDYPDEDIEPFRLQAYENTLRSASRQLDALLSSCRRGNFIKNGVQTAILGAPNAGKSSLLNALAGFERVIVTDIPGTTRDAVEQTVTLGRHLLRLLDTAGIRETADRVEELGVARALQAAQTCQLALFVVDGSKPLTPEDEAAMDAALQAPEAIAILNKQDLPCVMDPSELPFAYVIPVSCAKNEGLDLLEQALDMVFDFDAPCDGSILTNARQADAIAKSRESIEAALSSLRLGMTPDAVLVDVEAAMESLGEATGRVVREDITNRIFERFCVGK